MALWTGDSVMARREDGATRVTELTPLLQRQIYQARYQVKGIKGSTWMSPGQPPSPEEQGIKGRAWDFEPGFNLRITPRSSSRFSFQQLRDLAEYCDLVRMAVEKRKDQLCAMEWEIRPKDGVDEEDHRVKAVKQFFKKPDGRLSWSDWLRMLLEDVLVIDAPCIYVRPKLNGKPFGLELIDGATIRPIIDEDGRQPFPPDPAFQQVIRGIPAVDFTSDELLYRPRNPRTHKVYGFGPVEWIAITIEIILRRQSHKLEYYTEGSRPDLLLEMPENWTPEQVAGFERYWYGKFAGNTAERQRGGLVPHGAKAINLKAEAMKDEYDEWLARIVTFAFSLPPTHFIKAHSRANDVTQRETSEDEGKLPLMNWTKAIANEVIEDKLGLGDVCEFAWKEQKELDPSMQATVDDNNVKAGVKQIDEIRAERGEEKLGLKPGIVTATGYVPFKPSDFVGGPDPEPPAPPVHVLPGATPPGGGDNGDNGGGDEGDQAAKLAKSAMKPLKRDRELTLQETKRLTKVLATALAKAAPVAAKAVRAIYEEQVSKVAKDESATLDPATVAAAVMAHQLKLDDIEDVAKAVSEILEAMAKDGATLALKQVGITDEDIFDFANDRAVEYAKQRGAELVGKKWLGDKLIDNPNPHWAITDTTRAALRGYVVKATKEGWSGKQLENEIVSGFPFSRQRAEMIARTECAKADVEGNLAGWKESGVVTGKAWLLSSIHPRTDICDDNAYAGTVPFNSPFPSGDNGPPAHPMCECDIIPIVDEDH